MILRKTFIRCDACKDVAEAPDSIGSLGIRSQMPGFEHLDGWIRSEGEHHLCPACAKPYLARKTEMERELKQLAGIETFEVDI